MPINEKPILIFDLETTGLDYRKHDISQIGALVLDPRTLEPIPNGEFVSYVKPERPENADPGALRVTNLSLDFLMKQKDISVVWHEFANFVNSFNYRKSKFSAPIPAGYNILNFDFKFINPLMKRYGQWDESKDEQKLFGWPPLDCMHMMWTWMESNPNLKSISMDSLRNYFGINEQGHDALVDCRTVARLLKRFLHWQRTLAAKYKFEGSFKIETN